LRKYFDTTFENSRFSPSAFDFNIFTAKNVKDILSEMKSNPSEGNYYRNLLIKQSSTIIFDVLRKFL